MPIAAAHPHATINACSMVSRGQQTATVYHGISSVQRHRRLGDRPSFLNQSALSDEDETEHAHRNFRLIDRKMSSTTTYVMYV